MDAVKIDLSLVDGASLDYGHIALSEQNEISDCGKLGRLSGGAKPFIIGASSLADDGDVFWDKSVKYDGYISASLSCRNGKCSDEFRIYAGGKPITGLIVFFDKAAGQWAKKITIDETKYENNKYYAAFMLDAKSEHIMKITEWNKPRYPVRITAIVTGYSETYNDERIRSVKWTKAIFDENSKPFIGLTSAYGEVELADRDGIVENLAALSVVDRMCDCTIKSGCGGADNGGAVDATDYRYLTDRYRMNFGDNFFKVTLTDAVEKLRGLRYNGIPLTSTERTAADIFSSITDCAAVYSIKIECDYAELSKIKLKHAYLPSGTLYDALKEFCIMLGGTAYTLNDNTIEINKLIRL